MLESFLLPHLNTALSAVFEDLEPHQLYASILGGSLVLRNLKLKKDALAPLSIPVDVTYGHIEKLEIKLNILRLLTGPIVINAEDVLVVGTTQPPSAWNVEREEFLRDQQRNLTLLTDECLTYAREESGLPSVLQRAAYAIIQRIRLSVTRLEVRLEDTETASGQHFAFGLRAARLFNVRCDSNWEAECQPSTAVGTSCNTSASNAPTSNNASSQSWFDWLKSFAGRHVNKESPDEKIPESFHLKTVMEGSCVYLDPINSGHEHVSWLPYPAVYRATIIEELQKYLLLHYHYSSAKDATPWSIFRRPRQGEGHGIASFLPVSTLSQAVLARRMRDAASSGNPVAKSDEQRLPEVSNVDKRTGNSKFHPLAAFGTPKTAEGSSYNAHKQKPSEFLRFSDLYCPKMFWQIANRTAPHHMYILKPGEVELRVRCVQRPTPNSSCCERAFSRPSPMASYLRAACDDANNGSVLKGESITEPPATAELEKEPLPALTVIVVSRSTLFQLTTFQVACIFRWVHYAVILYQEVVSGVYAECLELTPKEDEMAKYRFAWRRHLVRYALNATNNGKALNLQIKSGQSRVAFTSQSDAEAADWDAQEATDEKFIREFEAKYWPTVILPLRQLALQDLKQKVCFGQSSRMTSLSQQQYAVDGGTVIPYRTLEGGQLGSVKQRGDGAGLESGVASYGNGGHTTSVQGLMEDMADELSVASEAEQQMIKCIQQMQPCRLAKSVQFTVQLYDLEVTLAAAYEAPACIRVKFDELYTHAAMYYDLRMQFVTAFEGVQVTDSLMPNLTHRRVVVSRSCTKSCREARRLSESWRGSHRDTTAEAVLSSYGCTSCGSNSIHGTPPLSPLQPVNTACILDWSTNCIRQSGCPLQYSKKEHEGEIRNNQDAPAGGWLRFDKSFVPLEGIPDVRLYLQTHGSLLCTITPAAVAYVVEALQQPVHLVEGSSILEAASREVQEALRRNELFFAQLLVGEVDHLTVDVCVDIPVSHKFLVPFSHEVSQCRGVLFQSGVVSVDSSLNPPQLQALASSHTCIGKPYDRYSIVITGACLQRVINCQLIECSPHAYMIDPYSPLKEKGDSAQGCSVALKKRGTQEVSPHNIYTSTGTKCRRWEELHANSSSRRLKAPSSDRTDNRLDIVTPPAACEANEANSKFGTIEVLEDGVRDYIMWPVGLLAHADVCNNLHSLTDLPALAVTFQDHDFSGVCITLTDKDIVAFTGFLATVQAALKVVAQLWDAPLAVDENADVKPFSGSTSSATLPLTETKESCSTKLQMLRSFTRTNKLQDRMFRGRYATETARRYSSRGHRRTVRDATSGGLSDFSGGGSMDSLHNIEKSSTFRRVAFYLHRSLHNSGFPGPNHTILRKRTTHIFPINRLQQAGPSLRDSELSMLESNNSTNFQPVVSNCNEQIRGPSAFEDVEDRIDRRLELDNEICRTLEDDATVEPSQTQLITNETPSNGLIGFDIKLGLSIFEFRLYREECKTPADATEATEVRSEAKRPKSPGNSVLLRCRMGNSRIRINCPAQSTSIACTATLDEMCVSMGRSLPAETPGLVSQESKGRGHDWEKGRGDAETGRKHFQATCFPGHNASSENCASSGPAYISHLTMDSGICDSCTGVPVQQSWSAPVFQFIPPQRTNAIDVEEAATDVATALCEAANSHGHYSPRTALPSATALALRKALVSKRLRLTNRWMFPPQYPGLRYSASYRGGNSSEPTCKVEEQYSRCKPTSSQRACGGSTARDITCGESAETAAAKPHFSVFSSRFYTHIRDAGEEEVLVEDLVGGLCFFIPSSLHRAIATRETWQALATKVPAVSAEASFCLKNLLHCLEVRCTPLRITLDWGILSEHIALGEEVACEASKAYTAATLSCSPAAPAEAGPQTCGHPFHRQNRGRACFQSGQPTRGCAIDGETNAPAKRNINALDGLLMQNGGKLPWRVRASIVVAHCDVVLPTSTPSPYPNLPVSSAFCSEDQVQIPNYLTRQGTRRRSPVELASVPQRVQGRSSALSQHLDSSSMALHGLDSVVGSPTALRQSGRNRGTEADTPSREGTPDLLEAILATAPPLCVFSFSAATSFYSECHSFANTEEADSCTVEPITSQDIVRRVPSGQQTLRLLVNINQVRAELLQGPGGSDKPLVHLLEVLREISGLPETENARRPPLGGCMRPIGYGTPDLLPLTLLDGHRIARNLSCSNKKERSNSLTASQLVAIPSPEIPLTRPASQGRGFRASMESSRKPRPGCQPILTVQRHAIVDGCRCRVRAFYTVVEEPSYTGGSPWKRAGQPLLGNMQDGVTPEVTGAESAERTYSTHTASVCRGKGNNFNNSGDALVELEPLVVHLEPSIVVAGVSLLQLLQRLFLQPPPAASEMQTEAPETHSGPKQTDGSMKNSDVNGTGITTDRKNSRTSHQRPPSTSPYRTHNKNDGIVADTSPVAELSRGELGRPQSSFETAESSLPSTEGSFPLVDTSRGLGVDEGFKRSTTGGSPVSQSKASSLDCHAESRQRASAVGECIADGSENANKTLPLFWRLLNSLDAVISLKLRMECIQFESPSLHFTVEDLELRCGLDFCRLSSFLEARHLKADQGNYSYVKNTKRLRQRSVAGRFALKRLPPEIASVRLPQALNGRRKVGEVVHKESTQFSVKPKGAQKGGAGEPKEVLVGIKMMISAEALHKERIALESVLEPWHCSLDLRYTPGDILLRTLSAHPLGVKGTRQFTERPTVLKKAKSTWLSGSHVKDFKPKDGRQRSLLSNPKLQRRTKYIPASVYRKGSNVQDSYYALKKDVSNRSKKLQRLARIWGKYGTEFCAEVQCSWLNITAAPFLMDAVLDTANLIEAAQRALHEQLNKHHLLRSALRSGTSPRLSRQSKVKTKNIDGRTKNFLLAASQRKLATQLLQEPNGEFEGVAPNVCMDGTTQEDRPSRTPSLAGSAPASVHEDESNTEQQNVSTCPGPPAHSPSVTRVHGALGAPGEGLGGQSQDNEAVEEQQLPLLVNMTGLPLLVHVLNPERRASGAQGEESSSLTVDNYLVTDDFGIVRRKALATIPLAPSNPLSTTSDGAGEYEHNYSNTFVGSLCNAVTDANHVTSAPAEQSGIESVTRFWRSLCHGESFNVPLDDHGQTRKVLVRLQIAGSEFEIDDLCLDGSQVSLRELPIKLPALVNNPLQRDARKKQRHELLHASARILVRTVFVPSSRTFNTYLSSVVSIRNNLSTPVMVLPHPAVAILDTPAECFSTTTSSCCSDEPQYVDAPKGSLASPGRYSSQNGNTDTTHFPCSRATIKSPAEAPLVHEEFQNTADRVHSDSSSEHTSRQTPSSDGRPESETKHVSPCCPLSIQEHGGVVHVPLSWILPRAVVAHRLGYLGLDTTHDGSVSEPQDSAAKPEPMLSVSEPDGTPAVDPSATKPQTSNSLFFWKHTNLAEQKSRAAAVMTAPLTSIKIHGKAAGTRGLRAASSEEVEAFPNFYKSVVERWKDDMGVEPLYIIPSSCITAVLGFEENDPNYKRGDGSDSDVDTPAKRPLFHPKISCRRLSADTKRCLMSLLSNRQSNQPDYEGQGMEAKGYHDVYSLALSLGAKPLLDHTTLQQIALENSHSIASFDCRPQVLEFFHRSTQTNRASPDVACDLVSTTLSKHAHINNDETSSVASTAIAVTVYGQSRDLVSESDPLFFEVGLDAPISLGNRLFEPLRVSIIPTNSTTVQRHPGGGAAPDHQERFLPYAHIPAGGDINIQRAASGFTFELETTSCGSEYRHIYESKPLLIDCHAPSPASALDLTVCFLRSRILDSSGNRVQQHSTMYRHLSRHQPAEFSVQAEVVGWVQQCASSPSVGPCDSSSACDYAGLTNIKRHMWCTCVRMIRVFAPFWLVNRQPEALAVSYCRRPIQYMPSSDWRFLGVPLQGRAYIALGIAPDDEAAHLLLQKDSTKPVLAEDIRAARSRRGPSVKLSPAFRVDIVGRPTTVSVQMQTSRGAKGKQSRHFGVIVSLAPPPFSRSRIISIHSRFILKNCLPFDIWVRETNGSASPLRLVPGCQCAFHPQVLGPRGEALICITKTDPAAIETLAKTEAPATTQQANSYPDGVAKAQSIDRIVWSSQLSVARSASFQIRLKTPVERLLCPPSGTDQYAPRGVLGTGGRALSWEHHNIHIAIRSLENAAFAVVFSEPLTSEYLLVNNTNHIIAFAQSGIRTKHVWEILDRGSQVGYAWTDPQREKKSLRFSFWDKNQKVVKACDIARVRVHRPLSLPNSKEKIYFVTEVRGSRRRVTITLDAPSASLKNALGARKVWKSLHHDIFKIRRKRVQQQLKRETKAFLLARSHSEADAWRSFRDGRKVTIPSEERQLLSVCRERRTWESDETAQSAPCSLATGPRDPLSQRRILRFQKRETLKLASKLRSSRPACSGESFSGSAVFAEDTVAHAEPHVSSGSADSQSTGVTETIRRNRMTALLNRRRTTYVSGSRNFRSGFKRRGNRQSCDLSQRTQMSSTSSDIEQVEDLCTETPFQAVGFYGGILIQGFGISLVDPTPHELAFFCVSGIRFEVGRLHKATVYDTRFSIKSLQIDNGVPGAQHRTILRHATLEERVERHGGSKVVLSGDGATAGASSEGLLYSVTKPLAAWDPLEENHEEQQDLFFRFELGGQWTEEATLLDYVDVELTPIALHVEADTTSVLLRFLMQLVQNRTFFLMSLQESNILLVQDAAANKVSTAGYHQLRAFPQATLPVAGTLKPLYIHELAIRPMLIIFSTRSQRLQRGHASAGHGNILAIRQFEVLGDRMTDITNFPMKSRLLAQQCVFTNAEQLVTDIGYSYIQQCIWQLHKLVASIDVIGNPLRLITGVSSSLRLITTHRSGEASNAEPRSWRAIHCISTLVLNFASEFFTSVSNIAAGLVKLLNLLGLTDVQCILSVWPESIRVSRARIERPETLLEGVSAGCIGFVQLIGGSVLALRQIYDQGVLESGIWRLFAGTAQRIAFVLASPAVAILVFIAAVAAGLSSALRHKSVVEKTRPRRVFPPEMTVSPYILHTARAMALLEASTQKSLVPGMLQTGIMSFPLPQARPPRSRRQHHGEENRKNQIKDYLLVTSDFVVCLRDGKAQWVCRKEDIQECTVTMPAYILGAILAQQDLFVRNRERHDAAYAYDDISHRSEEYERASYDQGSLCVVHVKVANQLKLPEDVLNDFSAAYKAYLSHATAKRSVVRALRDNFKVHFGTNDPCATHTPHPSHATIPQQQNRMGGNEASNAVTPLPSFVEAMARKLSESRSILSKGQKQRDQSCASAETANCGHREEGSQTSASQHRPSFLGMMLKCQVCWRRRIAGGRRNVQREMEATSSWACDWLRFLRRRKPSSEPQEVTFTVRTPDKDIALHVFDALCSTTECYFVARRNASNNDNLD